MEVACTFTVLINAHFSVPFPQVGRGPRARILAMDKEVAVRSDIFLQLMSTMNGTSTSVLLVLLFIAKNIGTSVQMAKKFPLRVVVLGTRSACSKSQSVHFHRHDCRAWTWNFSAACQCRPNLLYVLSSISVGLRIPV